MPSHLTRHVFRRLIASALFSDASISTQPCFRKCVQVRRRPLQPAIAHRSLFDFARKSRRKQKLADIDPNLDPMFDLTEALQKNNRPPPRLKLAQAFKEFFDSRTKDVLAIPDYQIQQLKATFSYLLETYSEAEEFGLSTDDMTLALDGLKYASSSRDNKPLTELAQLLFQEVKRQKLSLFEEDISVDDLSPCVRILGRYGEAREARDLLEEYWDTTFKGSGSTPWIVVLKGFATEQQPDEVSKTLQIMEKHGVPFDTFLHGVVVKHYVTVKDLEMVMKWYDHPIADAAVASMSVDMDVLELCIDKNSLEWGDRIFKKLFLEKNPDTRRAWDLIFLWAAAKGKGVDEIERMMNVMTRRSQENGKKELRPTVSTINRLVKLANSKSDPYMAERYVALGERWGIKPNATTFHLQMEYRVKVGDLDGARLAYAALKGSDLRDVDYGPQLNALIVALCAQNPPPHSVIMSLADDLTSLKSRYELATVTSLALLHLQRGEMDDTFDLLNTHAFHFSADERATLRDALIPFVTNASIITARAWHAYNIIRAVFPLSLPLCSTFMTTFFTRRRPDMAAHVFMHMRQADLHPDTNTYVAALQGIARHATTHSSTSLGNPFAAGTSNPTSNPYVACLEQIHNALKIDTSVEPSTRLRNALMKAYTATGDPGRALSFWNEIEHSREGPSYSSIVLALRACEVSPFGERNAKAIWERLRGKDIEITREMWAGYVGAMAGQGLWEECVQIIEEFEK
ncbi:MAG: hypothetical protein Q9190_003910, partial [Brigantiaea leucoxantha]